MRKELLNLGAKSMRVINMSRSQKDEVWEEAVQINHIGQKLFKNLAALESKIES